MAALKFTLSTGTEFLKTVDDAEKAIHEFTQGAPGPKSQPLRAAWIVVDSGAAISREAIISVEPVEP